MSKLAAVLGFVLIISACAEQRPPVAYELVNPQLDETGKMQTLSASPMTLIDSVIQQGVPARVATAAFLKYDQFADKVKNDRYITMIDFTQHSSNKRMFVVDRNSGHVDALETAHGEGSDPNGDGIAEAFSNVPNSRMSSLGSYIINERYVGKWGASMRMDGLESTNSNVRKRAIVLHPASYVREGQDKQGLSWGCPAVPFAWIDRIISRLRDGSFMYVFGVNEYKETSADLLTLQRALAPDFLWTDESESAPADGGL